MDVTNHDELCCVGNNPQHIAYVPTKLGVQNNLSQFPPTILIKESVNCSDYGIFNGVARDVQCYEGSK